ncbi:GNAT family N-acetyltransferase [Frankia sp. R82]|uniref:GNAT family N-acetyltransferase n=1 Tax=Frankia sp. R82 TaxID=2950553 RepID=UPI002044389E|nr:GNAT family N-acetyltransferase [Frankia sp. R82]MCM3886453.1 GNAT family N-acetyltransferase [Frankia sp. R82]
MTVGAGSVGAGSVGAGSVGAGSVARPRENRRVEIRPATADDVERIARVDVLARQAGYQGLLPQHLLDGLRAADQVPKWTAAVREAAWPHRGTLVAVVSGDVVGFVSVRPAEDDDPGVAGMGEISSFHVLPALWSHGIGRCLMVAATATMAVAGHPSALLWVVQTNIRAIRFYTHRGWRPDGATRDDVVDHVTLRLRYRRELR